MSGAELNFTGTIHPFPATPSRPHIYEVHGPTKADVDNAANSDDYPRTLSDDGQFGGMTAWLRYETGNYRPQGRQFHNHNGGRLETEAFTGNRNPKYNSIRYTLMRSDDALDAFRRWWCQLPTTVAERKYMHTQLRDVISALLIGDTTMALSLLGDVNLAVSERNSVAEHVKRDLITALEATLPWDYQDPDTRGPFPYTWPEDRVTNSGTSITISTA